MAKAPINETDAYKAMLDLLTDEEKENLARLTGQGGGSSVKNPVIKISYGDSDDVDPNGKSVPKGNFVLGQKSTVVAGVTTLQEAGTDLGKELSCVILKSGTQYSFWSGDAKKRCSSQILCERGEVPVGYNLKNVCNDKSCPRRKDGVEKGDRCGNQYVVFVRLPAGTKLPDGSDCPVAMFYIKGESYMPFKEYLDVELKGIPSIAVTTKFSTEKLKKGQTTYFNLVSEKGAPVPVDVFRENFGLVSGIDKQLLEHKAEQSRKMLEGKPASSPTDKASGTVEVMGKDESDIVW